MDDVLIIGGGPAGSVTGCYLSMAGIPNTILESANHPRQHVGESMVTSTTRIFKEIGFLETMERERFPHKYGASWHPPGKVGEFDIRFEEFPQEGIDQDYTYHVNRERFDMLLLKRAEELGSRVLQGFSVSDVLFDGDRATGVRSRLGSSTFDLPGRFVVDASGRKAILGRQRRLLEKDPLFDQYAVHTWFRNLDRGSGTTKDYIHIYFLETKRGWVWQIPITDEITSVGVVAEKAEFRKAQKDVESWFFHNVEQSPDLERAMKPAERIRDFKSEGDYSYSMSSFAGENWLLVGDAARFVDPIFSSGVSVACYSAKYASEAIVAALQPEAGANGNPLAAYESRIKSGVKVWYDFIKLYYKLLPLFTYFIREGSQHRLEVLRLLQGEVFDIDEAPVLDEMRKFIRTVEGSGNHPFAHALSDIPID